MSAARVAKVAGVAKVITNNLKRSGLFAPIDQAAYIQKITNIDVPPQFVSRVGAESMSLVFSGRNLALWSDYSGIDPETNSYGGRTFLRVDAWATPNPRRFVGSVNLTF